ncbi:MAG: cysteine desulfurase NifS [Candidatus Rokubacteria bacterium RIFCSPHIGHO2_12_FULL_73_22]|nr:MAG: cysteine desulfurase NifS [Candidatus Rokubacteria bacterium RIFCSPHIGHO2_12_FULL_73_22]OGL02878.1 MAG: cysteine desulfurase NifS [Candidatus Rokubacteria bacterium RIFCSPHIGHO2_02_FULL_73_26]OGL11319.1 MAG: cysteine desulfurase NifS [Candidatus Rokubacteria bacterium RIFCSPLOWO2_02_FULL_73_56]OGL20839.1 MAG: cysteine desulfurase NifS [Candidatus Rokubacteria bacterium RIFCSPLOWO2_12_FULL_73_47]
MTRRVYLDHNASTPVHPEVLAEMLPYFSEVYGNPSSIHAFGRAAREGVDLARERVAQFLGVAPTEVVFTSGGTESDNFGIKGLAFARGRGHLITSKIEHHAVLRTCQALEGMGFEVTYVGVDGHGMVDPDEVRRAIRPDTIAVSIMHANSEVGTLQPIEAIGRATRERGIPLHVDAVQTFGKVPFDVHALGIDALSFSAHKIYGPKGIAGLYVRKGTRMVSIQHGGEHERRRRAGTENVPGIVGLGKAVEVRAREMAAEAERLGALRTRLWEGIRAGVPEVRLSGHPVVRLPGTASLLFRHIESESLVLGLDLKGIGVSAGSACTAGNVEPSHVLVAMGVALDWAMGAVRCSLGRSTTAADVDYVVASVATVARKLREALPVGAA